MGTAIRHSSKILALILAATTSAAPLALRAQTATASPGAVNVVDANLALHGFDPVSYFTDGKPQAGVPSWTASADGATYRFATSAHRDAFVAAPEKYVPQYGGFCAMGAAMGKRLDVDPALYRVVEGKLYLNVNKAAQAMWLKDIPGNIAKANSQWAALKGKTGMDRM